MSQGQVIVGLFLVETYSILKLMPEKEKVGMANRVVAWWSAIVISAILTAFSWQYAVAFLGNFVTVQP